MQVLHDTFADDPTVSVLAVHISDKGDPEAYLKEKGYTFPTIKDGSAVFEAYNVSGIPMFMVVGPDGKILQMHTGRLTDEVRDEMIETVRSAAG